MVLIQMRLNVYDDLLDLLALLPLRKVKIDSIIEPTASLNQPGLFQRRQGNINPGPDNRRNSGSTGRRYKPTDDVIRHSPKLNSVSNVDV